MAYRLPRRRVDLLFLGYRGSRQMQTTVCLCQVKRKTRTTRPNISVILLPIRPSSCDGEEGGLGISNA